MSVTAQQQVQLFRWYNGYNHNDGKIKYDSHDDKKKYDDHYSKKNTLLKAPGI